MTDTDRLVVWLREAMDAEAALAERVAARHTVRQSEYVEPESVGQPFWPLAGARRRYEEFAAGNKWSDPDLYAGLALIEAYNPQRVLRRIAADRKTLDECVAAFDWDNWGATSLAETTIRNLADGYGWKDDS